MDQLLGFSTGVLYKSKISINDRIEIFGNLGCSAVELGYGNKKKLNEEPLEQIDLSLLSKYSWVSLHAPVDGMKYKNDTESNNIIKQIEGLHKRHPLNLVVFHPDTIEDFSVFENVPFPVGIENMDAKKVSFQTEETLTPIFKKFPGFKMILDINHCYTNDASMELSKKLEKAFGNKIAEIHASGYGNFHEPFFITKQNHILNKMPIGKYPIILEAGVLSFEEAKKEYDYVSNFILNKRTK